MSSEATPKRQTTPMKLMLVWLGIGLLALLAALGTLTALNSSLYSASAFVQRYFDAVAGDNIREVLRTPGVELTAEEIEGTGYPVNTSTALLRSGLINQHAQRSHVISDVPQGDGSHVVTMSFTLAENEYSASYAVAPADALLGLIHRWRFSQSPLQLLSVQLNNGTHLTVGGLTLDARASSSDDPQAFSRTAHYLAVAPAVYTLSYNSELVAAAPVQATVLPEHENSVTVDTEPTQLLVEKVQSNLDDFLGKCVTQQVLQPTGCPFGIAIDDRLTDDPVWSIVSNPVVTLTPAEHSFAMPQTPGVVHFVVGIQHLFDGKKSTVDKDVDYSVGLTVHLRDDGSIAIQLQ